MKTTAPADPAPPAPRTVYVPVRLTEEEARELDERCDGRPRSLVIRKALFPDRVQ